MHRLDAIERVARLAAEDKGLYAIWQCRVVMEAVQDRLIVVGIRRVGQALTAIAIEQDAEITRFVRMAVAPRRCLRPTFTRAELVVFIARVALLVIVLLYACGQARLRHARRIARLAACVPVPTIRAQELRFKRIEDVRAAAFVCRAQALIILRGEGGFLALIDDGGRQAVGEEVHLARRVVRLADAPRALAILKAVNAVDYYSGLVELAAPGHEVRVAFIEALDGGKG